MEYLLLLLPILSVGVLLVKLLMRVYGFYSFDSYEEPIKAAKCPCNIL